MVAVAVLVVVVVVVAGGAELMVRNRVPCSHSFQMRLPTMVEVAVVAADVDVGTDLERNQLVWPPVDKLVSSPRSRTGCQWPEWTTMVVVGDRIHRKDGWWWWWCWGSLVVVVVHNAAHVRMLETQRNHAMVVC